MQNIVAEKDEFWHKEFSISSITRDDLVSAGFSQEQVVNLSDADMAEIASAMQDVYFDCGYWEDMRECASRLLAEKEHEEAEEA